MKKYIITLLSISFAIFYSCSSDSEEPMMTCDSEGMTYTNDIAAILNSSCATSTACHNSNTSITFSLATYADVLDEIPRNRISGSINRRDGFDAMPRGASKLPDCTIEKIDEWLADGAPE